MKTRAAYVKAPYQLEIREVDLPEPAEGEALVRVRACGICGSDLNVALMQAKDWQAFGHEMAGTVERIGANPSGLKPGDSVTLESSSFCGVCAHCRDGRVDLCRSGTHLWLGKGSMGFSDYIVVKQNCLVPYSGLSFAEASLAEPMGVAMDLIEVSGIRLGDSVMVIGLGPIGLMALRMAKLAGAGKLYAAARSHSTARIELARKFGADEIVYTDQGGLDAFRRGGIDRLLLTAPPQMLPQCVNAMNFGGIISYIGMDASGVANVTFDAERFHVKRLQLRASYASPALFFPKCLELMRSGMVDGKALITSTFPLEGIAGAMEALRGKSPDEIKMVMVNPD